MQNSVQFPEGWKEAVLPWWPSQQPMPEIQDVDLKSQYSASLDRFLRRPRSLLTQPVAEAAEQCRDAKELSYFILVMSFSNVDLPSVMENTIDRSVFAHGLERTTEATLMAVYWSEKLYKDYRGSPGPGLHWEESTLYRLRHHLAGAPEATYKRAEVLAEGQRKRTQKVRAASCALFPTRQDWVEMDAHRNHDEMRWVLAAAGSAEIATRLIRPITLSRLTPNPIPVLATMLDKVGAGLADALLEVCREPLASLDKSTQQWLAQMLGSLPSNDALEMLYRYAPDNRYFGLATLRAVTSFPERSQELLKERGPDSLLYRLAFPTPNGTAHPSRWPEVLRDPPWERKHPRFKALAVASSEQKPELVWGLERKRWLRKKPHLSWDWSLVLQSAKGGSQNSISTYLCYGPDEQEAISLIPEWSPRTPGVFLEGFPRSAARFGLALLPHLRRQAKTDVKSTVSVMTAFGDPNLAMVAAEALARLKGSRQHAKAWFRRHPAQACRGLIPSLLGKRAKERGWALNAISYLQELGQQSLITEVSREFGEQVEQRCHELLQDGLLSRVPKKLPALPDELVLSALPPLDLLDGGVLPRAGVRQLLVMLSISTVEQPYPGLAEVKRAFTPASLDRFTWGLFENWHLIGGPPKQAWAMLSLGWLGGEEVLRKLIPFLRRWPKVGASARATQALAVFQASGTNYALRTLYRLCENLPSAALRRQALAKMEETAQERGLSSEQLADRVVDDLGLDDTGQRSFHYGTRTFQAYLNEELTLVVSEQGRERKNVPPPKEADFKAFKVSLNRVVASQRSRLEQALVNSRRWTWLEFKELLLNHSLNRQFARWLLWGSWMDTELAETFRVTEDGTLADQTDETWQPPSNTLTTVGLVHPLHLAHETLVSWSELFLDYKILQPFPQVARPIRRPNREEEGACTVDRLVGTETPSTHWFSLQRKGWLRAAGHNRDTVTRESADATLVTVVLTPGMEGLSPKQVPQQTIESVEFSEPMGQVEPVFLSECLLDLEA